MKKAVIKSNAPVKTRKKLIAPSLLAADFSCLGKEVKEVEGAGADWIHVDVMDGHFVPNITMGPMVVSALKKKTKMPMDCHLMVTRPEDWIEAFARAGADMITIHQETCVHLQRQLSKIRSLGCKAGVSINPATPISTLEEVLDEVDLVLVMSVNPGFGGQKFLNSSLTKIQKLAALRAHRNFIIQVDGGVVPENAGLLWEAGADCLVAGSAIFSQKNRKSVIRKLREANFG